MNYIKNFKLFTEEAELDVNITDAPDVKMAKEELSDTKKYLIEYKSKKPLIDKAYLTSATDIDLQRKIEEIVGKDSKNRNPFLIDYLQVANLKRKLDKTQKDITNDKLKKDDFNEELKLATEDSTKKLVNSKLSEISNRIASNTSYIASLSKEISDAQNKLDKKMIDIEKSMTGNIKKISSEVVK